jgi:hypothetical protein
MGITWGLMAVILINYYNSILTSFMLAPKLEPVANTIEELAQSTHLRASVDKASVVGESILVSFI